jgi:predicted nucleotidyltransferase
MTRARIDIPQDRLAAFCRRHHIRKLALFGSVLREDFGPDSDVDVLVEFEPGHTPGLIGLGAMERELAEILGGRRVDLMTVKGLSHRVRDHVLSESEVAYG